MINAAITEYHSHIAGRRALEAEKALHHVTGAFPDIPNAAAKLRLAADILEREHAVGDWPGEDALGLIERAVSEVKTVTANLELGD